MTAERFSPCPHDLVVPEERAAGKLAKGTRGQLRGAKPGAGKGKGGGKGRSTGGAIKTPPVKEKTRRRGPSGRSGSGGLLRSSMALGLRAFGTLDGREREGRACPLPDARLASRPRSTGPP